ncbi:MAG: hypothetical protein LBL99_00285 [Holosporaceae bacterium]|nr:hypothetical protein [Holosporaceae bacterium]
MKKLGISVFPLLCFAAQVYACDSYLGVDLTIPESADCLINGGDLYIESFVTNNGKFIIGDGKNAYVASNCTLENNGNLTIRPGGVLWIKSGGTLSNDHENSSIVKEGEGENKGRIEIENGGTFNTNLSGITMDDPKVSAGSGGIDTYKWEEQPEGPAYDAERLTPDQLRNAAYFDLVNSTGVTNFKVLDESNYVQGMNINFLVPPLNAEPDGTEAHPVTAFFQGSGTELELKCDTDRTMYVTLFSIPGYVSGREPDNGDAIIGVVPAVDENTKIIKTGSGRLTIESQNSWHNGVFDIKRGSVEVTQNGEMFGGNINVGINAEGAETQLIWRGGPQDQYNKPTITLFENSSLSFDLSQNSEDNKIFSVYGVIETAPGVVGDAAIVNIDSGEIRIRSDCSDFKGKVIVDPGATLIVRKDRGGQMFGGTLEVREGGDIAIRTNYGLEPLTVGKGTVTINREETDSDTNSNIITELKILNEAHVIANFKDAVLESANIQGTVTVRDNTTFNKLVVDGGTVAVTPDVQTLNFHEGTVFGSNLDTRNGRTTLEAIAKDGFTIYRDGIDHSMKWELDLNPSNNSCDWLDIDNISVLQAYNKLADGSTDLSSAIPALAPASGGAIIIDDFELLHAPEDQDFYIFQILHVADGGYPDLRVEGNAAADKDCGAPLGPYQLRAFDGKYLILKTPDARPVLNSKWSIDRIREINGIYLPTKLMHYSALLALTDIHAAVYDSTFENDLSPETYQYGTWGKFFKNKFDIATTQTGRKIESEDNSLILGCDLKPIRFKRNLSVIPSFFASYSKINNKYVGRKSRSDGGVVGAKVASFIGDSCLFEAIGSYGLVSSKGDAKGYGAAMESHSFSLGARASYRIPLKNYGAELISGLQTDYFCFLTNDTELNKSLSRVCHRGILNAQVSPNLGLAFERENVKAMINAKFNVRLGGEIQSLVDDEYIHSAIKVKKRSVEYKASVVGKAGRFGDVAVEIGKASGGKKGLSAKFACAIKL